MNGEDLLEALQRTAGDRECALSLSDEGLSLMNRLGAPWLDSVLRTAMLTFSGHPVDLVLRADRVDPMEPGRVIVPGLPGDTFTKEGGIGMLTVEGELDVVRVGRRVSVPGHALLDERTPHAFVDARHGLRRRIGTVYGQVYRKAPLALDRWKQSRNYRRDWRTGTAVRGAQAIRSVGSGSPRTKVPSRAPAAWMAMHWLEPGGAESWALESAAIARDAGFEVIVTVDRAAPQRLLDTALAVTPHIYLAANTLAWDDWGRFGLALLREYDVRFLHIHHSATAYQFLPGIRHLAPGLRVIDSTHLAEHRTGGFVRQSLEHSELIDLHHVISPVLRDNYVLDSGVPADRVAYRPLTGLAGQDVVAQDAPARVGSAPLRIGFLGRLAPQKRPFLFVELARRLERSAPGRFRFVMQGSGALDDFVTENIARAGLTGNIERRAWGPAEELFKDIDVLAITSDNEGLTLTALEADRKGVVVLSADVGSQVTVVVPQLLAPPTPDAFLRHAVPALRRLADDPARFAELRRAQHELHDHIRAQESASDFMRRYYADILEESE